MARQLGLDTLRVVTTGASSSYVARRALCMRQN
jgi:hypothetical protein